MSDNAGESMGEYEEMWGLLHEMEAAPILTRESYWRTKDGKKVQVGLMEDSHLLNTITMLRGRSPIGTKFTTSDVRRRMWLNVMANEAYSRGLTIPEVDEKDPVHE